LPRKLTCGLAAASVGVARGSGGMPGISAGWRSDMNDMIGSHDLPSASLLVGLPGLPKIEFSRIANLWEGLFVLGCLGVLSAAASQRTNADVIPYS